MAKRKRATTKNRIDILSRRNYLRKILANPPMPGTVGIAHIYHDDRCGFWKTGECDCDCYVVYEYPNLRGVK